MPRNIEVLPVDRLDEADEAIRETSVDLVMVTDLFDASITLREERIKAVSETIARIKAFTPNVQADWTKRRRRGMSEHIRPFVAGIMTGSTPPHIDPALVGYGVSINFSTETRGFYANRHIELPRLQDWRGRINTEAIVDFNMGTTLVGLVGENDWTPQLPGSGAFFSQYPNPAVHAAQGNTTNVNVVSWEQA